MIKHLLTTTLVFISFFALSQASLEILLVDSLNAPVVGQGVTVSNEQIGYAKQFVSSENGKVQIAGLSTSGKYTVIISEGGIFQGRTLTNISLISNKTKSISVVLSEKLNLLSTITINGNDYQSINTVNGEVASELSIKELQELPVEGRDITRALYRLPNITQATGFFPEAPNVSINGANALYTNYEIDGMDNNENFLGGQRFAMPLGFTKNITALTNNFSAEHGLTSNGIVNITTQSGTNKTSGEVFYIMRPGPALDSPSRYAQRDLSGNQVKDGFMRYQAGFGIGGAIKKDKTFYFLNVEHTTDIKDNLLNIPQLGINETVRGRNNFSYISGKLDQHWSPKFHSSLRVNVGLVGIERQGGGLEGGTTFNSAGNTQTRNSVNIAFKNTYTTDRYTYEGNYSFGRFHWNYAAPLDNQNPDVSLLDPSGVSIGFLGHPGYAFEDIEETHVVQQKITLYQGNHRIKAGLQLKSSGFELYGGGNPNGSYLVQLNQTQLDALVASGIGSALTPQDIPSDVQVLYYGVELRPNSFSKRQNIYSAYVEDQWSVGSRLNVNLGLRYDYDDLSKGGSNTGDMDNIAPRVSLNYELNERSAIRAGYGMYYDKILYAVYSDAVQFNSTSTDYQAQLQALVDQGILPADTKIENIINEGNLVGTSNAAYLQGPTSGDLLEQRESIFQNELRVLNPNGYDNPYSHQMMLGYQQKTNENTTFYVDLMHNRSHNLFRLRNLNAPAAYNIDPSNVVVQSTTAADLTRPVPVYTDGTGSYSIIDGDTIRGGARNVVMTESAGRSNYYAMNFTFQKDKGDDKYAFRLMYTLSFLENNTEDINFRAMDGNDFEAEWGPSINDRTHLINGIVNYYPVKNLTLTLAALIQSGQPINRIPDATIYGTTDLNGDGRAFGDAYVGNSDRHPGEDRNSDRLPWSNTFDLSALYRIPMKTSGSFEVGAQVFNILNAENLSGYSNNARQSNQVQTGSAASGLLVRRNAAPPRQFQFSVRYTF